MKKGYEIVEGRSGRISNVAVARDVDGFHQAVEDKNADPSEPFYVVELVQNGNVRLSLLWRDGRWQ